MSDHPHPIDDEEEGVFAPPEDDMRAANLAAVAEAKAEQAAQEEGVYDGTADGLPPRARVEHNASNLPVKVFLPLLVPVTLPVYSRTTPRRVIREEEITELEFGRLTGRDMESIYAATDRAQPRVAAQQACRGPRMSPQKFAALWPLLDGADQLDCQAVAGFFLTGGRRTGRSA